MTRPVRIEAAPMSSGDRRFYLALGLLGGSYLVLLIAMLVADLAFTTPHHLWAALQTPEIRFATRLSLLTCALTTLASLWVAVPLGYLLSRVPFPGRNLVDLLVDIPIVLPPLVVGLSLLILFQTAPGRWIENVIPVTYADARPRSGAVHGLLRVRGPRRAHLVRPT